MKEKIIVAVVSALITAAVLASVSWVKPELILKGLNVATEAQVSELSVELKNRQLQCKAYPVEDGEAYKTCGPKNFELAKWCSGDCSGDDAKVTLCCSY